MFDHEDSEKNTLFIMRQRIPRQSIVCLHFLHTASSVATGPDWFRTMVIPSTYGVDGGC